MTLSTPTTDGGILYPHQNGRYPFNDLRAELPKKEKPRGFEHEIVSRFSYAEQVPNNGSNVPQILAIYPYERAEEKVTSKEMAYSRDA